jgi:oligopeptide transport system substrate-binding protein
MTALWFRLARAWIGASLLALAVPPSHAVADPGVLRIGNGSEPESLDPQMATGVSAGNILRDLHEGLTARAPRGEVVPAAAESWDWRDDRLQLCLRLREGLRWSNGDPLVAGDFAAGLRRLLDPATAAGYATLFAAVANGDEVIAGKLPASALGIEVLSPQHLCIRLDRPLPSLPALLAHPAASPIHPRDVATPPATDARLGNGAYRLFEWRLASRIVLLRNPNYWNDAHTAIDRVVYLPIEDLDSELKRYRADELDVTTAVPAAQARWIDEHLSGQLHVAPYLGSYFYGLNLTRPPFAGNAPLRQALSMAIDRDVIAGKVLHGFGLAAHGLVPPGAGDHSPQAPAWSDWPRAQREAEARRLYAAAGYSAKRPLEVEIRYNTSDDHKRIAVVIAAMWKQVLGADVRLANEEWKVFLRNRRERAVTEVFRNTWIGDSDDALGFLELFGSQHPRNDSGYADAEFDALLRTAEQATEPGARRAALEAAERKLLADAPLLPIHFYTSRHLVKPRVRGWQDNALDWHYTKDLRLDAR